MKNTIKIKHLVISNVITILIIISLFLTFQVIAAPNRESVSQALSMDVLSYQGTLVDDADNPVNGDHDVIFRIYNDATAPAPLWEEGHMGENAIPVENGLFNVMLGSLNPIPDSVWNESELYLGIEIGSEEMSPREIINLLPPQIAPGSLDANILKAGSLERNVLRNYLFYYNEDGIVFRDHQQGSLETALDPSSCLIEDEWCCNSENTICLNKSSTGDARLAFNISGGSPSCWLAHNDDDHPLYSKGIYYATNAGGTPFEEGVTTVFFFSREGQSQIPIRYSTTYDIYCFE